MTTGNSIIFSRLPTNFSITKMDPLFTKTRRLWKDKVADTLTVTRWVIMTVCDLTMWRVDNKRQNNMHEIFKLPELSRVTYAGSLFSAIAQLWGLRSRWVKHFWSQCHLHSYFRPTHFLPFNAPTFIESPAETLDRQLPKRVSFVLTTNCWTVLRANWSTTTFGVPNARYTLS